MSSIKDWNNKNCRNFYYHIGTYSYVGLYTLANKEYPTWNFSSFYEKEVFNSEVRFINISDNYVSIMVLYIPLNYDGFPEVTANIKY